MIEDEYMALARQKYQELATSTQNSAYLLQLWKIFWLNLNGFRSVSGGEKSKPSTGRTPKKEDEDEVWKNRNS